MTLKERFKKSIHYTWYLYLISAIVPCIVFPIAYSFLHRPLESEKLNLFISCDVDTTNLENKIHDVFKNNGVKTVDVYSQNSKGNELMYLQKLNVIGLNTSDIIIVPSDRLGVFDSSIYSLELNDNVKSLCGISNENLYTFEGKDYAVEIPDENPLKEYVDFDVNTKYYSFLSINSFNIGEYSSKPIVTENAFKLLKYILGK